MTKLTTYGHLELAAIEAMYLIRALTDELKHSPDEAMPSLRQFGFVATPNSSYTYSYSKWSTRLKQFNQAKARVFNPPDGVCLRAVACPDYAFYPNSPIVLQCQCVLIEGGQIVERAALWGNGDCYFKGAFFEANKERWEALACAIITAGKVL